MTLKLVLNPFSYPSYFFLFIEGKHCITIKVYCWDNLILLQFFFSFPLVTAILKTSSPNNLNSTVRSFALQMDMVYKFTQPIEKLLILRHQTKMQVLLPKQENNISSGLRGKNKTKNPNLKLHPEIFLTKSEMPIRLLPRAYAPRFLSRSISFWKNTTGIGSVVVGVKGRQPQTVAVLLSLISLHRSALGRHAFLLLFSMKTKLFLMPLTTELNRSAWLKPTKACWITLTRLLLGNGFPELDRCFALPSW